MFEHMRGVFVTLFGLSLFFLCSPDAAVVTLRDGSTYSGLSVAEFDGGQRNFQIVRNGKQVSINASDVSTIEFQQNFGTVKLIEGSSYPNLEVLQFDVPQDRLTIKKGPKVLNLPLSDIAWVGIYTLGSPGAPLIDDPATDLNHDLTQPPQTGNSNESPEAWQEEGLYSNLPDGFGERKITTASDLGNGADYTPRWTTETGAKAIEKKKADTPEKRQPRKALSTKRENTKERAPRERRSQARSAERRSGGSSRDSGRGRRSLFDSGVGNPSNETSFR